MGNIDPDQKGCVVAVPSKRISRLVKSTIDKMRIRWDCTVPSNAFHWDCWNDVVRTPAVARGVGRTESNLVASVEDIVEIYDGVSHIIDAAESMAEMLEAANRVVCFTGAGISAAAGIPTYRGSDGIDTMDQFGGAVKRQCPTEEKSDESNKRIRKSGEESFSAAQNESPLDNDEDEDVCYEKLQPTETHRGLARLHREGKMHYCITQNCDDLHAKGGFPREALSELHGNVFCEFCEKCETEYFRDYSVDAWSTDW